MKIISLQTLTVPEAVHEHWQQIMMGDSIEKAIDRCMPVRRYLNKLGGGSTWIPKWGHEFVKEWHEATGVNWYGEVTMWTAHPDTSIAQNFLAMMMRLESKEFFDAGISALRLGGPEALHTFTLDAQVEYRVQRRRVR